MVIDPEIEDDDDLPQPEEDDEVEVKKIEDSKDAQKQQVDLGDDIHNLLDHQEDDKEEVKNQQAFISPNREDEDSMKRDEEYISDSNNEESMQNVQERKQITMLQELLGILLQTKAKKFKIDGQEFSN